MVALTILVTLILLVLLLGVKPGVRNRTASSTQEVFVILLSGDFQPLDNFRQINVVVMLDRC